MSHKVGRTSGGTDVDTYAGPGGRNVQITGPDRGEGYTSLPATEVPELIALLAKALLPNATPGGSDG